MNIKFGKTFRIITPCFALIVTTKLPVTTEDVFFIWYFPSIFSELRSKKNKKNSQHANQPQKSKYHKTSSLIHANVCLPNHQSTGYQSAAVHQGRLVLLIKQKNSTRCVFLLTAKLSLFLNVRTIASFSSRHPLYTWRDQITVVKRAELVDLLPSNPG